MEEKRNVTLLDELNKEVSTLEADTQEALTDQEDFALEDESVITQEYFEKTMEEMESMNFVEITKVNRELKYQSDSIDKAKESVESILKMQEEMKKSATTDTGLASAIASADAEVETGVSNMENFLNTYEDTKNKLNALIEKSETVISSFSDVKKTTSYLNNCMLEVLDKNITRLKDTDGKNYKVLKAYYNNMRDIYTNRSSVDYIQKKIETKSIEMNRLKMSLKKDKTGNVLKNIQKKATGLFSSIFNTKELGIYEKYLEDLFQDADASFYLQYALTCIYSSEKANSKYGEYKWIEILIMNILDITVDSYDLEGGKELYDQNLLKLKDTVNSIITKKK